MIDPEAGKPRPPFPPGGHVWVDRTERWLMAYRPGLLVDWQTGPEGWQAWVSYLEIGAVAHGQNVRVRTELLEERWVRPAVASPPEADRTVFRPVNEPAPPPPGA